MKKAANFITGMCLYEPKDQMSIDAAGTLAGLFGAWAIAATAMVVVFYRRLQALQQHHQQQEPKQRAALAAIRRAFTAASSGSAL